VDDITKPTELLAGPAQKAVTLRLWSPVLSACKRAVVRLVAFDGALIDKNAHLNLKNRVSSCQRGKGFRVGSHTGESSNFSRTSGWPSTSKPKTSRLPVDSAA
jgi:hypothetical protein